MQQVTISSLRTEYVPQEMKQETGYDNDEPPSRSEYIPAILPARLPSASMLRPKPVSVVTPLSTDGVISPKKKSSKIKTRTREFRKRYYPGVADKDWDNWQWQIANRIYRPAQLTEMIRLTPTEAEAVGSCGKHLPLGITPYYMSLVAADDMNNAIRRTVVPTMEEFIRSPGEADDPLGEDSHSPVPGLVHRYPDRVLVLATDFCSVYCRYCTRSRMVGKGNTHPSRSRLQRIVEYVRDTPEVRDVLISGGDPLTMSNDRIEALLAEFRAIPHVEIIRIGTKIPVVLPQRITKQLTRMLKKYHPIWMSLHFTHPNECTPEAYQACARLADAGIPLGSQTVLLKGINDDINTMKMLVHHLMKMRVKPYYLFQCDPITGSGHFRTPVSKGIEIIKGLRGFTSGYAIPTYTIDAPGGGGKVPITPDYIAGRTADELILNNYENRTFSYPDPTEGIQPLN